MEEAPHVSKDAGESLFLDVGAASSDGYNPIIHIPPFHPEAFHGVEVFESQTVNLIQ